MLHFLPVVTFNSGLASIVLVSLLEGPTCLLCSINPLTPVPGVTGRAKTHHQFPVPAITGHNNILARHSFKFK